MARRNVAAIAVLVAAIAIGAWLLVRDDDAGSLERLAGVERVDGERVRMDASASAREVRTVLDRVAQQDGAVDEVALQDTTVDVDRGDAQGHTAAALVALGAVEVPGGIELDPVGSLDRVRVRLRRGTARRVAARSAADVLRHAARSLDAVTVEIDRSGVSSVVTLSSLAFVPRRRLLVGLDRAAAFGGDLEGIEADRERLSVTVHAATGDPRRAWRRAARALGARTLTLLVGDRDVSVSGPPGPTPDRALRLADRLRAVSASAHLTTDLRALAAGVDSAKDAAKLTRRLGGVLRASAQLRLEWDDPDGGSSIVGEERTVAAVAPRLARLSDRYVVGWEDGAGSEPAKLVVRPKRPPGSLFGNRKGLHALIRDVRSVRWPGAARYELIMGGPATQGTTEDGKTEKLSCPGPYSTVTIVSTSTGRARSARGQCNGSGDYDVARAAWNASAG